MPAPAVYVCIRRTLEWADEAEVRARLVPAFRPKMEVWNATFDVPYHLFRHRLKAIAQANLGRVEGAVRAPLDAAPEGAVVIPVDDDDWLAPDLALRLRERYAPEMTGYLWVRSVLEPRVPWRRRLWYGLWSWKKSVCDTNNYAIVRRPDTDELVRRHLRAGRYFAAHAARIARVPGVLAIQNRNVSSQTAMGWRRESVSRDELVRSYRRYRGLYDSVALPDALGWARPCVAQMAELMRDLRVR